MIEFLGTGYALAKEVYEYLRHAKEVYDTGKGVYDAAKDAKKHFEVKEIDPKVVDFNWPDKSGFKSGATAKGYTVVWSKPEKVASYELDGYEIMYEVDKAAHTKRRLVLYDGLVLIGRKDRA